MNYTTTSSSLLLVGRALVASLFYVAAYNKITGFAGYLLYFGKLGIPFPPYSTPVIYLTEITLASMFLLGWKLRYAALGVAAFSVVAALFAHLNLADANQQNHFFKNMVIAGGMLAFFVAGAGAYSLDARSKS